MTVNVEELVLDANSDGLRDAVKDYDKLGDAGENTESRVSRASQKMGDSVSKEAAKAVKALGGMVAAYVSLQGAQAALNQARSFDAAFAETSTLIEGTTAELAALEAGSKSLADLYGTSATSQIEAYYQAISAGASDVTVATEILDSANRLAIGGITEVSVGVDALTTAVNAYGPSVITAGEASDAMFVAMRAGKTTIGELSSNLGNIVPIAASAGVAFDEVVGGIAALTTQGLSTSAATTQLRQVIAGIIKPTQEAKDAAQALGLEFDVNALKSKGLAGFLEDVIDKTDGSTDEMAKLFGSVEALGAALAFAGGGGEAFTDIMASMETKIGSTDVAVKKISDSLSKQLDDDLQRLSNIGLELGEVLLEVAVPALGVTVDMLQLLSDNSDVLTPIVLATGAALTAAYVTSGAFAAISLGNLVLATGRYIAVAAILTPQLGLMATAQIAMTGATTALTAAVTLLTGPLGIIIAGVGAATIAFSLLGEETDEAALAANAQAEALGSLDEALISVNLSTEAGAAQARRIAADHYAAAEAALSAAEAEARLALERFNASQETFNPFDGPSNAELREVHENLLSAQAAVQALRDRMAEFGAATNESGEVIDENTGRVVKTTEELEKLNAQQRKFVAEDRARSAEALNEAQEILTKYQEQAEMQRLIGVYGSDSAQVAELRREREKAVVSEQLQGLQVAESLKQEILDAVDATYQTEAATAAWEQRMAGVVVQVNAIGNALNEFGSAAINTAANNAEIAALEAGASVQEAAHTRTLDQINLETKARLASTDNIVEQMAIRAAAAQKVSEVESQAALAAARAAANERDAANASSGSGRAESQREYNKELKEAEAILNSLMTPQDIYNDGLDQANRLLNAGILPIQAYTQHVEKLKEEFVQAEYGEFLDGVNAVSESMIDAAFSAESYKDVLGDMAEAGINALADLAAQMLKNYILQQLMNAASQGASGGGFIGAAASFFGGARAEGGPAAAGVPYLVNEQTPNSEIFVPSQSGAVLNVSQAQEALRASPQVIQVAPTPVNLYDDPRTIDRHRMSPDGERARQRADRRLENA